MARIWHNIPGQLLAVYLALDVLFLVLGRFAHTFAARDSGWLAVDAFLAWPTSLLMVCGGLLAGLALTLAFLGSMTWKTLPGCRQTGYGPRLAHPLAGRYARGWRLGTQYPAARRDRN
jgi:hypothetical protein